MTSSAPDEPDPDRPPVDGERSRKLLVVVGGSLLVTGSLLALVLSLGSWAYRYRHYTLHDGRLSRLVAQRPPADRVTQGLLEEGARALPTPRSEQELRAFVTGRSPAQVADVAGRARKWPAYRVFAVQDVVYVLYFDAEGNLRDYVVLGGRPSP
jgi:hypothetical protein